jgi:hypothetical protein
MSTEKLQPVDVGFVDVESGELVATDISTLQDRFAWQLEVENGAYPVTAIRVQEGPVIATAAMILQLNNPEGPIEWEQLIAPAEFPEEEARGGFIPENGCWGIVDSQFFDEDAVALLQKPTLEFLDGLNQTTIRQVDVVGTRFVLAALPVQHHDCVSWAARAGGELVQIVTEFGVLDIDPVRDGGLPWDAD